MKRIKLFIPIFTCLLLLGCGGGGSRHHHDDEVIIHYAPDLNGFHMVDSYGDSSEDYPGLLLALNPFIDNGFFEVYWTVDAVDDYTVELRINDQPSFFGSRLITNDYCGYGLPCDLSGTLWCEYNSDFSLSCDPPQEQNPGVYLTYVDDWVYEIPQSMYFILEVCDTLTDSCETRTREVLLE